MAKLLTVEDETAIRELLAFICETDGHEVVKAASLAEAREALRRGGLDLILLDVMLPDGSGFDFLREVRTDAASASVPVVMITARGDEADRVEGLDAGADDYVVKPFSLEELAARVDAHLRRERRRGTASELRFDGQLVINYTDRRVTWAGHELGLVRREFDIVEFLSQNPGMVFDRERIYECVWGIDGEGDSAVISEHVRRIRAKFAAAGCERQYIETVWGVGYRWAR